MLHSGVHAGPGVPTRTFRLCPARTRQAAHTSRTRMFQKGRKQKRYDSGHIPLPCQRRGERSKDASRDLPDAAGGPSPLPQTAAVPDHRAGRPTAGKAWRHPAGVRGRAMTSPPGSACCSPFFARDREGRAARLLPGSPSLAPQTPAGTVIVAFEGCGHRAGFRPCELFPANAAG